MKSAEDLDAFAESISWFDIDPDQYTGEGTAKTRKAPSLKAKEHNLGTIKKEWMGKNGKL